MKMFVATMEVFRKNEIQGVIQFIIDIYGF
jgi:hypothetical protein